MIRILFGTLLLLLVSCDRTDVPVSSSDSCLGDLDAHRTSVDEAFAVDDYPLSAEQKAAFDGLDYFPPSEKFCIPARFSATKTAETFDMPTYNEKPLPFKEYGVFEFNVDGVDYSLTAYQRMDLPEDKRQWVLVPFKDQTNGHGTYGGGRYLEIKFPINERAVIDFNRASNPWCAYDAKYTCPIPPLKNWLSLQVEAGEKMFGVTHSESV